MCAVLLLLPLSNFLFVVVFALDDAALLQLVNIHSLCWQLNSDWNLALPRFAKMHFHCFSALFTIQMQKQQRFVYMPSHTTAKHSVTHTHREFSFGAQSKERARESERKRASSAWQTHGFCFWQNTLGVRRSSSKSNMDHLQLVCVCCRCLRQRRFALCTVVPGAAKANRCN